MAPCELKPATVLRVGLQTPRCAPGPLLGKQGTESPTPSSCTSSFSRSASWHSRLQCAEKPGLKRPCFTVLTQALNLLELLLRFASQIPHEPLGRAPGPVWATHQSWGAGKLGAGEHLALFGAAQLEDLGDRRRGLLSRFLSAESKSLKVKCPPRARTSTQVPRVPVHAVSWGPAPNEAPAE